VPNRKGLSVSFCDEPTLCISICTVHDSKSRKRSRTERSPWDLHTRARGWQVDRTQSFQLRTLAWVVSYSFSLLHHPSAATSAWNQSHVSERRPADSLSHFSKTLLHRIRLLSWTVQASRPFDTACFARICAITFWNPSFERHMSAPVSPHDHKNCAGELVLSFRCAFRQQSNRGFMAGPHC
jgi:hypothetical protein